MTGFCASITDTSKAPKHQKIAEKCLLSCIFYGDDDTLAEDVEGGLEFFGLGLVVGIEHAPDDGFANTEAPGELGVRDALLPHGQVEREFTGDPQRHGNQTLASFWF